jgi:sodium transport system permease protein
LQTAGGQGVDVPRVEVFYNSSKSTSIRQFQVIMALLEHYRMSVAPLFFVNSGVDFTMENNVSEPDPTTDAQTYDLATKQDSTGSLFAALLPMLLLIMLFSGCAAVAPESIAGEKERGTMATLLATPMARWELALGKTISLACTALLSGLSSFTGAMLSLPKTMGYSAEVSTLYGGFDYLKLLVVILSTVMLFVCIISLFSALAKTVKEAATYVAPLMIVVTVIGATGMFSTSNADSVVYYLIPVYNSIQCMTGFFLFSSSLLFVAVTVAVNMGASALCIAVLTWMFGNERIVFNR